MQFGRLAIAGAIAAMAVAGHAVANEEDGRIEACRHTETGLVRIVDPGEACRRAEQAVSWNRTGPGGPAGPTGAAGAAGPAGPTGAVGPAGPAGRGVDSVVVPVAAPGTTSHTSGPAHVLVDEFEQLRIPATVPDDWRSYDVVVTWSARTPGGLEWAQWSVAERTLEPGARPSGFAEPVTTELSDVPSLTVHRTRIATLTRNPGAVTELRIFPRVAADDVRGQLVYAVTLERRS